MTERRQRHGEAARAALLHGVDQMAALLRPTLGPLPRSVAIARLAGSSPPEVLDSAATIARRTLQLADPFANMGAMIVRHLAWRVFEQAGDGAATAAVLAQALLHEAARYLAGGANPVGLERGIRRGLPLVVAELRRQARPVELPSEIAALVAGTVREPALAELIGEAAEAVGPDGAILVEDTSAATTSCEYQDGVRWNEGYVSHFLLPDGETSVRLFAPRVFLTDHLLERAEQLLPALEACLAAGDRGLLVVAPEIRDSAVGLLVLNRQRKVLDGAVAVRAPAFGTQRTRILEDLAVITGGRCLLEERQERLTEVSDQHLGRARQAWATRTAFGVLGGKGDRVAIRQRIAAARLELGAADDLYTREKIKERIGKLAGAVAIIRVGAPTSAAQEELKVRIEAAVKSAQAALGEGVVPGGGAALLACQPALAQLAASGDEALGLRALSRALAEPLRTIARNAGLEAGLLVEETSRRGEPWVFDVVRREWVDARQAGLVDPLAVVLTALETSVSAAATALSAEVLIQRKEPPVAVEP
jgi:chaperonin GroEL